MLSSYLAGESLAVSARMWNVLLEMLFNFNSIIFCDRPSNPSWMQIYYVAENDAVLLILLPLLPKC